MSQSPVAVSAVDAYEAVAVEAKWRARWEQQRTFKVDLDRAPRPFYNLMMFPYPSAEGLHVGNFYAFSGADIYGRYRRLKGDDVFEPIGFDAFGIHTENYALKIGEHPGTLTPRSVARFKAQLKQLGALFDWEHSVDTTDPDYYRWTQWLFLQLFDAGLAEQREGAVNWCPSCLTVLADEQVLADGTCERCESRVQKRVLEQWWLKTTKYAQPLLDAIEGLDWSEKTRLAQRNWIGRSEGALIRYDLEGCAKPHVDVFTTRPDTLSGATFLVVGADQPRLLDFCGTTTPEMVEAWRASLPPEDAEPDFSQGLDLGSFAIHPITAARLPVWAAPYVLGSYGTGVIHAVPAHDERDWQFARAHGLTIVEVISGGEVADAPYTGEGVLVNSGEFNGVGSVDARRVITARLGELGHGRPSVQFRLRDWLISRQRYWGPPIPIIHCEVDGAVRVPDADLPVRLPEVKEFRPLGTGVSPLAAAEDWVNVPCPVCGRPARRETDVSDTFLDSAWYFLRYPSAERGDTAFDRDRTVRWLPVDMYIGGHEHAVLHLLYSRFVMRALHDLGMVSEPEPFKRFRAHGLIGKGGAKMSKSKGNTVNPDEYMARHGVDVLRLYLMSVGPFERGGEFSDQGIIGMPRFLNRVWRATQAAATPTGDAGGALERRRHRLLRDVDERIAELQYNTAISKLIEFTNAFEAEARAGTARRVDAETLLVLLAPFAPHITEELWERTGHRESIHNQRFPDWDPELAAEDVVTIVVQENGTRRAEFTAPRGTDREDIEAMARALPRVRELLATRELIKVVVVPDRIVNLVVRR